MTVVLVLTGLDLEARALARHLGLEAVAGADWPRYRGGVLEVMSVGPGAGELPARVAGLDPRLVVSAGTCGALDPALRAGDLVVPEAVVDGEGRRRPTAVLPGVARRGSLLAGAGVVASPADKARLWLATGALAVDLESAPILAWAAPRGIAAAVVRAVSDPAAAAVPAELAGAVEPGGRLRAARALRAALARPGLVMDAMALGRGTAAALRAVAGVLAAVARSGPGRLAPGGPGGRG